MVVLRHPGRSVRLQSRHQLNHGGGKEADGQGCNDRRGRVRLNRRIRHRSSSRRSSARSTAIAASCYRRTGGVVTETASTRLVGTAGRWLCRRADLVGMECSAC